MEIYQSQPHPTDHQSPNKSAQRRVPIRPIVNWTNAPAYKIAKLLVKKLEAFIPLPNVFNVIAGAGGVVALPVLTLKIR
jgi:hypothetical protein